ncbi:hypothetical protein HPB47_005180 [Ixodes persulcatus]|uniref:Uncharacterized protein n=1 Tax=Ixodes persulcatus TaxID=34615 RepID=A0AC60PEE2_IXOPE|nr:hypothetical protein HPB47_005180 [Ixodes persulcatus]
METMDTAAVTANHNAVFQFTTPTLNTPKPEITNNWPALPANNSGPPPSQPHPAPVPQSTANEIKSLLVALLGKASKEEITEMFLQALDDLSRPEASGNKQTTIEPRFKNTPIFKPNEKESATANTLVSTAATQNSITEDDGPPWSLVQSKKTIKRARYTRKKTTECEGKAQASRQRFTVILRPRTKTDLTTIPRRTLEEAFTKNTRHTITGDIGRTAMITFEGNRLPRFVRYALCITPVYPYRAKAVTCTNCHGAGHKQDICHKETVCSLCGKHHEETQDDQGNSNPCPNPTPYCQICKKNGHLATSNVCPKKTEIGKLLRERARKHAKPNQESRRKKGAPQPPPPPPPLNPIQPPPMLERTYAELVRGTPAFDRDSYENERFKEDRDFNLPHTSWGYKVDTINGQKLLEDMTRFKYTLLNTPGSTTRLGLTSRQRHTSPDLTWIYGKTGNLSWHVNIDTWGSDHFPIKIEVDSRRSEKNRRFVHTVNWDLYRRHLKSSQAESFATAMLDALKAATTRSNIPADAPTPDIHLLNLWARRLRALQRYRRGPKTPAALREVTRHTKRAPRGKTIRSIVAIDVRKAFDSVPHWAVIQEAERLGIQGRALNFIKAFLKDRTYSVRIGDHMSDPRPNRFTVYADDISLWTVTGDTRTQQQTLQAGLDEVQTHLNRVDLTASPEKTNYVVVASRKQRKAGIASQMYLTLAGNRIQPSTSIRILGMYIDEDGSCRTWMTKVSQQCKAIIHVIRRICSSRGGANEGIARQMVKALIVSKVCYCASYYNISKSQWKKLETINRQAARVITGLPRFTPIETLMKHAQLNTLQETVMVRSVAHRERLQHSRPGRTILSLIQSLKLTLPDFPENDPPWVEYIDLVEGKPIPKNASFKHPDRQTSQANSHNKRIQAWESSAEKLAVYTDAAFATLPDQLATVAVAIPEKGIISSNQLPNSTSVKGGELGAIQYAMETVLNDTTIRPKELHVFTDSIASLTECRNKNSPCKRAKSIKKMALQLSLQGTKVQLSWAPAHAGIAGNEQAHSAARALIVTLRETQKPPSHLHDHGYASSSHKDDEDEDDYDPDEAKQLIKLSKAAWEKARTPPTCCYCKDPQHAVDLVHLLWGCKGLETTRKKHLKGGVTSMEDWRRFRSRTSPIACRTLRALLRRSRLEAVPRSWPLASVGVSDPLASAFQSANLTALDLPLPPAPEQSITNKASFLDLVFVSNLPLITDCSIQPSLAGSDHNAIRFSSLLTLPSPSVDDAYDMWLDRMSAIEADCVPSKHLSGRRRTPWISKDIIRLSNKKRKLFRKAKKTNPRKAQRELKKLVHTAHKKYLRMIAEKAAPKLFWAYLKSQRNPSTQASDCVLPARPTITEDDTMEAPRCLNVSQSAGPDGIHPAFRRACSTRLCLGDFISTQARI